MDDELLYGGEAFVSVVEMDIFSLEGRNAEERFSKLTARRRDNTFLIRDSCHRFKQRVQCHWLGSLGYGYRLLSYGELYQGAQNIQWNLSLYFVLREASGEIWVPRSSF